MTYISILLPFLLWIAFRLLLGRGPFEMDFASHKFSFLMILPLYRSIYWGIFVLSLIGAFTFASLKFPHLGIIFLLASICALLFNLWIAICYEGYVATRYSMTSAQQSNYSGWKYALTLSFGTSAIIFFLIALTLGYSTIAGF